QAFIEHKALDFMFDTVKHVALPGKEEEEREAHQL
ncbi:TPA: subtype I-F CRISPR-associated endonuclease Cas1, partial [Vibrio cholerae]|nr:subtype I-F CRISPR-associated endonuclease Cas1 [Vibrio cholerae]HDI3195805.1 subtype I-F CRISPR-associated endonuclease Cas1 [Vibrio cholerae]